MRKTTPPIPPTRPLRRGVAVLLFGLCYAVVLALVVRPRDGWTTPSGGPAPHTTPALAQDLRLRSPIATVPEAEDHLIAPASSLPYPAETTAPRAPSTTAPPI